MPTRSRARGYQKLLDCPHAVFVLDATPDGRFRIVAFNEEEERLVGVTNAEAAGRYVDELLPGDVAGPLIANYRQCIVGGEPMSYDERIHLPSGERHCVTTLVPIADEDGRVHRIIGLARDVTEERAALAALRASEELFRQLAENIREVFWMTDAAKTEMLYISPRYETTWGRTCESLRRAPASWLDGIHHADRARVLAELPSQRHGPWQMTYRVVRPDGSERWIRDRSFPVHDSHAAVQRLVGLAEDITELVQAEEHLRRSQKIEALGTLSAGVAHDFNNLLSVILSYALLLRDDFDANDPRRADVEEVQKAGERGSELTRQLLAFSRKQPLAPRLLDLRESVGGMDRMLRRVLAQGVRLVIAHGPGLGSVRADPGQIEQVILNLVINASDAMAYGGTLTVKTSNVDLDAEAAAVVAVPAGSYVVLSVSDEGVGMDDETVARIFEPFFTTKDVGKGTGLGLSTVLGIVRQSGGAIRVQSAPGCGTTFDVYLPLVTTAPAPVTATPPPMRALRGTETVLLVEDEEHVRALVRTILRRAGYTVLDAPSAGDALLICEQHRGPIHLTLTDVVMPHLTGEQLAARLARLRPTMKVLFMSGHPGAWEDRELEPAFVKKPITPEALCEAVRAVLDAPGGPASSH